MSYSKRRRAQLVFFSVVEGVTYVAVVYTASLLLMEVAAMLLSDAEEGFHLAMTGYEVLLFSLTVTKGVVMFHFVTAVTWVLLIIIRRFARYLKHGPRPQPQHSVNVAVIRLKPGPIKASIPGASEHTTRRIETELNQLTKR